MLDVGCKCHTAPLRSQLDSKRTIEESGSLFTSQDYSHLIANNPPRSYSAYSRKQSYQQRPHRLVHHPDYHQNLAPTYLSSTPSIDECYCFIVSVNRSVADFAISGANKQTD